MTEPHGKLTTAEYKRLYFEYVPLGVWIFWSIVGLLIIGRLIPGFSGWGSFVDLLIKVISAAGAAIAGVAAYLTVRVARDERREERFNRRPYFSFVSGEIAKYYDEEEEHDDEFISIFFKQVGANPAADITATVTIIMPLTVNEQFLSTVKIYRAVNDIAANSDFKFSLSALNLADRHHHHYVVLDLEYYDAIYRTPNSFSQRIYMQWAGLDPLDEEDNKHSIVPITREVKPWIINMMNQL